VSIKSVITNFDKAISDLEAKLKSSIIIFHGEHDTDDDIHIELGWGIELELLLEMFI